MIARLRPYALSAAEADVVRTLAWQLETERLCVKAQAALDAARRTHAAAVVAYAEQVAELARMRAEMEVMQ